MTHAALKIVCNFLCVPPAGQFTLQFIVCTEIPKCQRVRRGQTYAQWVMIYRLWTSAPLASFSKDAHSQKSEQCGAAAASATAATAGNLLSNNRNLLAHNDANSGTWVSDGPEHHRGTPESVWNSFVGKPGYIFFEHDGQILPHPAGAKGAIELGTLAKAFDLRPETIRIENKRCAGLTQFMSKYCREQALNVKDKLQLSAVVHKGVSNPSLHTYKALPKE